MNATVTRVAPDQLRQLHREGGVIRYTDPERPDITPQIVSDLLAQVTPDGGGDGGVFGSNGWRLEELTDKQRWQGIADQLNYAPTPSQDAEGESWLP